MKDCKYADLVVDVRYRGGVVCSVGLSYIGICLCK